MGIALCMAAAAPLATGCYGRFQLTRAIYRFNGDVTNDKLARSILFWVFVIIPVYQIAAIGDVLIFNLIEFWTGEELKISSYQGKDGSTVDLASAQGGQEAVMTIKRDGRVVGQERFVRLGDGRVEARDAGGRLVGTVERTTDDGLRLVNADGSTAETIPADFVRSFLVRN
ncbi:MAG: DUF3332 family protein [Candidatus Sumerlaeota bacterium]|nr:DUF3332 family protein [Candidatus Sumerlaeota bacterium]